MADVLEAVCVGLFFVVPVCLLVLIFILSFFGIDLMMLVS